MSDSSSSSPSRERRRTKKDAKKNAKRAAKRGRDASDEDRGSKKAPRKNAGREGSAPRQRVARDAAEERPNFGASGLLDEDAEEDAPADRSQPASGRSGAGTQAGVRDRDAPRNMAMRSRSRDVQVPRSAGGSEGRPPAGGSGFGGDDQGGKGGGKGKDGGKGGGKGGEGPGEDQAPKEEPNFEASGLLGLEDNAKNGIPLKFTVPPEARYPTMKWRLYIFTKGAEEPKIVHVHRMIGILFGKDRRVVDVPTDHPTCSKQQAVLHYRLASTGEVKPYIMDLESTNGTFLNGERLQPARYYEMRERDVLKFGMSSRDFVLLHGGSANHMSIDPSRLRSPSQ